MKNLHSYGLCLLLIISSVVHAQAVPKAYPKNTAAKPVTKTPQPVKSKPVNKTTDTTGYTAAEKKVFMAECVKSSKLGEAKGNKYCSCVLAKLMKRYPTMADLNAGLDKDEVAVLAKECLATQTVATSKWTSAERTVFLKNCSDKATETIGGERAKTYCDCMLGKIEIAYPDPVKAQGITQENITKMASECNAQ